MDEVQLFASIIETIGTIGLLLLWLRDKNDQLRHERDTTRQLSGEILRDWQAMASERLQKKES